MDSNTGQAHTIAAQTASLSNAQFKEWIERRINAQTQVLERVADVVGDGDLDPLAGARIASCVAGSVFGYEEFHPRASQPSAELMLDTDLISNVREQRQLATH